MKIKNSKLKINGKYNYLELQEKWNKVWQARKIYHPDLDNAKNPYYVLYMFPYPSAEGLHVGHAFSGTGADVYARFKRMKGEDVFHPMGFDAFGIHSENFALKINDHPQNLINRATKKFREQFDSLGFSYDWEHSVNTSSPDYYKWTQWLFVQLFKAGLAEKKKAEVNWCPSCKTVLADEQVLQKSKIPTSPRLRGASKNQKSKIEDAIESQKQESNGQELEKIGVCERCETPVLRKELEQWFFKITDYADKLLEGLDRIDPVRSLARDEAASPKDLGEATSNGIDWTEKVKLAQRNWIGKSEGLLFTAPVKNTKLTIDTFSAHFEAFYADTFVVIAPDHPRLPELLEGIPNRKEIEQYCSQLLEKRKHEKPGEEKEPEGIFTGRYIEDPIGNGDLPIWVANYALKDYGTGIVKCSAHDERDFAFAQKYGIRLKPVLFPAQPDLRKKVEHLELCYTDMKNGILSEPSEFSGEKAGDVRKQIIEHAVKKGFAKPISHYHLRDWLISRQRYWGAPIPMVFCESCAGKGISWSTSLEKDPNRVSSMKYIVSSKDEMQNTKYKIPNTSMAGWFPVPESDLPVLLPYIENFKPLGTGVAPLAQDSEFVNTKCPICGGPAKRETDVADTFLDSSWYFLRYPATDLADIPFPSKSWNSKFKIQNSKLIGNWKLEIGNSAKRARWLPVPMYIGGAEHSVLHLLYSRFVIKALHDHKFLDFDEPFTKFRAHGLIIKDGAKMSKSRGNVVNPDDYIKKYGADTLRAYLMFLGPFDQGGDFRDSGIEGMERFLKRVKKLVENHSEQKSAKVLADPGLEKAAARTVKGVESDIENLRYNTAIAKIMEFVNDLNRSKDSLEAKYLRSLVLLLAPFAPYMAEELWQLLKPGSVSVHLEKWPIYDEAILSETEVTIAIQVNGKLRETIKLASSEATKEKSEAIARESSKVKAFIEGKVVRNIIYVPGKILNFVTD